MTIDRRLFGSKIDQQNLSKTEIMYLAYGKKVRTYLPHLL